VGRVQGGYGLLSLIIEDLEDASIQEGGEEPKDLARTKTDPDVNLSNRKGFEQCNCETLSIKGLGSHSEAALPA
jgi:hypothetical protein